MPSKASTATSFVENAPPGELAEVIADLKSLALGESSVTSAIPPAVEKYNKDQLTTTKLPGGSQLVIVSNYNELDGGRFFDTASSSSFAYNHEMHKASDVQSHPLDSPHASTIKSLLRDLEEHVKEHFPSSPAFGVYPTSDGIAILVVGNKYSPSNYWNGRWRSTYLYSPTSSSLTGTIQVDVHYYEDGNVRLQTRKPISEELKSSSSAEIVRSIAGIEKKYQEELNRAFGALSEGAFKNLRRQLPVTRQKVEWDKISGYRLGQDIGGGRSTHT